MHFSTNSQSSGQSKNDAKTLFFHSPSPLHSNFCNCNNIGPEVPCDHSRLLAWKITKRIHSSKPASLNRPIASIFHIKWAPRELHYFTQQPPDTCAQMYTCTHMTVNTHLTYNFCFFNNFTVSTTLVTKIHCCKRECWFSVFIIYFQWLHNTYTYTCFFFFFSSSFFTVMKLSLATIKLDLLI